MKFLIITFFISLLGANEPQPLHYFLEKHLILTKSKMSVGPTLWMDDSEGYLRNETIFLSETLLDSLDAGKQPYSLAIKHFQTIDDLRVEIKRGEAFNFKIKIKSNASFNTNYFSSSIN
ncbi:MAG: hypothetical protein HOD98_00375 [Candidatus Marinimicrobia bacterium]|jgi:hypothetical protein|nr:hypothetical protein [Candidatus Neomarinimicrobiota bacterium]